MEEGLATMKMPPPSSHPASASPLTSPPSRRAGIGHGRRRFRTRTEPARERDVWRHLNPWCDLFKPTTINRPAFTDAENGLLHRPEACPDTALAAFAQLSALRMSAQRCLVSLVTKDTEYILADTTQAMSLQHDTILNDQIARMWIGTCQFRRDHGPNDAVLDLWQQARDLRAVPEEPDHFYTQSSSQHWNIISDARSDPRLQQLKFLQCMPSTRFYASVPLRSAHGSVIGAITIMDDAPRFGVSCTEMAFLEDIADTVVEHLANSMVRAQSQRAERLIQALGLFNAGKDSLRDWWLARDDIRVFGTGRHARKGDEVDRQSRLNAEFGTAEKRQNGNDYLSKDERAAQADYFDFGYSSGAAPRAKASQKRQTRAIHSVKSGVIVDDAFDLHSSSAECYARASNLLRESMGADGVVFFDAKSAQSSLRSSDSDDSETGYTSNPTSAASELSDSTLESSKWCTPQGFSNRTQSSTAGFALAACRVKMRDALCRRLVKRYPNGFVFHFDRSGEAHVSSDEFNSDTTGSELDTERKQRKKDGAALARAFKDARTIALYPLWDEANERWRSCVFAWSTTADRYFAREEHLTYLTTFGHSLLAGLARLDSMAADNAKGTFISSISHELRSPLHGVMAGVEFLQESELTSYQQEMTRAISMAARTLLDTINHVLDYSKISGYGRARKKKKSQSIPVSSSQHPAAVHGRVDEIDAVYQVDLARLVEEVTETTVAAHRSQYQRAPTPLERPQSSTSRGARHNEHRRLQVAARDNVTVTCNISGRKNWITKVQPGGLTRIITNLLGNALKYTIEGTVSVQLKADASTSTNEGEEYPVTLIVEDTGIGIAEVFQTNGLFTPFTQEDPHSTGTGLGLSIVRQIAHDMGAQLSLTSARGVGTTVTLSFTVRDVPDQHHDGEAPNVDWSSGAVQNLDVDSFHLICDDEARVGNDRNSAVGSSVLRLAKQWLQCEISNGLQFSPVVGNSICAIVEDELSALQTTNPDRLHRVLTAAAEKHSHILVLGSSIQSLSPHVHLGSGVAITPIFVHQPIGPQKLLRAIASDHPSIEPLPPISSRSPTLDPQARSSMAFSAELRYESLASTHGQTIPVAPIKAYEKVETAEASSDDERPLSVRSATSVKSRRALSSKQRSVTSDFDTDPASASSAGIHLQSSKSVAEGHEQSGAVSRDTILLVEDNEINMKLLVALMRKLKVRHHCASHGREAIDLYRTNPRIYFLVMMDISMPVMDGYTATSKIRKYEKRRSHLTRVTIVALTGVTSPEAKARAFDSGVDEFYPKPVRMKELKELVDRTSKENREIGNSTGNHRKG